MTTARYPQIVILVAMLLLMAASIKPEVPSVITYQGRLTNPDGGPVENGVYEFIFSLYPDSLEPDFLWQEVQAVEVTDGFFSVELGKSNPIPPGPFIEIVPPNLYLGIRLVDDTEMLPRTRLASNAYSIKALHADEAAWSANAEMAAIAANVFDSSITEISIRDGSIGLNDIGQNGASPGQVIKWTESGWDIGNDETGAFDDGDWTLTDYILTPVGKWGLASAGNVTYGDHDTTHINFGTACTTGAPGFNDWYIVVGGGYGNAATRAGATVSGGYQNRASGTGAAVGGGITNYATYVGATVGGGGSNFATGLNSTVAGGNINEAAADFTTVAGGVGNQANDTIASVLGGQYNYANGVGATIGGGMRNVAHGQYSFIGGGGGVNVPDSNSAIGDYSIIPGGRSNVAQGDYSFAAGRKAQALHAGCFIWADSTDSNFSSARANEFAAYATNGFRVMADNADLYGGYFLNLDNGDGIRAVANTSAGDDWAAVFAYNSSTSPGIYAYSAAGYAGYFEGNVNVTGSVIKAGGSYKIDHPADPERKFLAHAYVGSSEQKNVYDGVIILDGDGIALVDLPDWFDALNGDFRYQLTAIGAPGPNLHIAEEITGNRFKIAGGDAGMKVSWQVTGLRRDAYASGHPLDVEQVKSAAEIGKYLHPEEHGVPVSSGINYDARQEKMGTTAAIK
jgi:hypothetical protein